MCFLASRRNSVTPSISNRTWTSAKLHNWLNFPSILGDELFNNELTMQRKISWTRVRKEMVPYLEQDDAFYSSLTLIMVPRDLSPLVEGEGYEFTPINGSNGDIGQLLVKSTLVLFPADGQHRVASIKEALKKHPDLANVSVPVIFMPFRNLGNRSANVQ